MSFLIHRHSPVVFKSAALSSEGIEACLEFSVLSLTEVELTSTLPCKGQLWDYHHLFRQDQSFMASWSPRALCGPSEVTAIEAFLEEPGTAADENIEADTYW